MLEFKQITKSNIQHPTSQHLKFKKYVRNSCIHRKQTGIPNTY